MRKLRTLIAATIVLTLSWRASAQEEGFRRIARPADAPRTIGEAMERSRNPVKAAVIGIDDYSANFLIPGAGSVQGSNGTFFRSDLSISNLRSVDQVIGVGWMAQAVDNRAALLTYFLIPANTTSNQDDFVGIALGKSGLGAIIVFASTASSPHTNDSAGQLNAFSRIWTYQPGSSGTVSQGFPAISLTDSIGSLVGRIIGLKQSSQYRTNIGIVNLDSVQHTWTVRSIATGALFSITVPAVSMNQQAAPANSGSAAGNAAYALQSDGFGFWWSAYGTSVDNITGDGWVSRAIQ